MARAAALQEGSVTPPAFPGRHRPWARDRGAGGGDAGPAPGRAWAQGSIGDRVVLATWPNYHDPANFDAFSAKTGAAVDVNVFGSNEEMLAKLQAGGTGWDVFVPTNYTITTYVSADLIEPLDLSQDPELRRRVL